MRCLQACIRSVLNQSYRDFEVILVDNNSSDRSEDCVRRRFSDLLASLGYATDINSGIACAKGGRRDTTSQRQPQTEFVRKLEEEGKVTDASGVYGVEKVDLNQLELVKDRRPVDTLSKYMARFERIKYLRIRDE